MPLVVPGLSSTGNKTEEWTNNLLGKKIGDASDNVVRLLLLPMLSWQGSNSPCRSTHRSKVGTH